MAGIALLFLSWLTRYAAAAAAALGCRGGLPPRPPLPTPRPAPFPRPPLSSRPTFLNAKAV